MNNFNQKQKDLLITQFYASVIFIITIIVSTILTYNNILKLQNKKPIFTKNKEKIAIFTNRISLTIIAITFTYINYGFYLLNKQNKKATIQKEELIASILTLIAGLILLDSTIKSLKQTNEPLNIDTPIF